MDVLRSLVVLSIGIFGIQIIVIGINGIIDIDAEGLVKLQLTCAVGVNFIPEVTDGAF